MTEMLQALGLVVFMFGGVWALQWALHPDRFTARRLAHQRAHQRALQLHSSNAWHCGCVECKRARDANHGDGPRRVGVVTGVRKFLGLKVESVQVTRAEWERL